MPLRFRLEYLVNNFLPPLVFMAGVGWLVGKTVGFLTGKRKGSGLFGAIGGSVGGLVSMFLGLGALFQWAWGLHPMLGDIIAGQVGACVLAVLFSKKVQLEGEEKETGEGTEPAGGLVRPSVALTLRQAFIGTFRGVKANLLPLTGTFILSLVLAGLLGFCVTFLGQFESASLPGLVGIVLFYFFASSLLVVGWVSISLKIVRGQKPGVSDLFTGFRKIIPIMGVLIFFISGSFLPGELLRQGSLFGLEQPFFLEGFPLFPIADSIVFYQHVFMPEIPSDPEVSLYDEIFSEGGMFFGAVLRSFFFRMNSFLVGVGDPTSSSDWGGRGYVLNPVAFIFNSITFFSLWVIADKKKGALASIRSVLRIIWSNKLYLFLFSLTLWFIWVAVNILELNLMWMAGGALEEASHLYTFTTPFFAVLHLPSLAFKALMAPLVFIFMAHVYEGIAGERTPRPAVIGKDDPSSDPAPPSPPPTGPPED